MSNEGGAEAGSYESWRERVVREVGEAGFEGLSTRIPEGIVVEPLYTTDHPSWRPTGEPDPACFPGSWRISTDLEAGDLEALRENLASDVAGGVDLVRLRLGRDGLPIQTVDDLVPILDVLPECGTEENGIELALDAGAEILPAAALLLAAMGQAELEPEAWKLFFQADPLGALAREGRLPRSMADLEAEQATLVTYGIEHLPRSRSVGIDTVPYQEGGAHGVQELAFAVASGIHYLRSLARHGVETTEAAGQVFFISAVGGDIFLEIAKLRALRALWSRVLAACGAPDASPRVHAVVSRRPLTRVDPWNNMLRVTTAAFAAAAGGADAVTTVPFDAPLGHAEPDARRLARNTQHILAEESHLTRVLDPAGGSYYIEWLTDRLARDAWDLMREVERRGGILECLVTGWVQSEIVRADEAVARAPMKTRLPVPTVSQGRDEPPTLADLRGLAEAGATLEELSARLGGSGPGPTVEPIPMRPDEDLGEPGP